MTTKQQIIEQLKERIGTIEWMNDTAIQSYALGVSEIDSSLKHGGITAGSCHEIIASHEGPALGFTLSVLSSMVKKGPILWCSNNHDFYTPGFIAYGIKDTDIIFAETKNQQQSLWAMEQGLTCNKLSAVILNTKHLSLAQGRRLKLLAQKHNTTGIFMVKPGARIDAPTIATTRWHISPEPSLGRFSRNGIKTIGAQRLSITLMRNLGGLAPLSWTVEFDEHALRFHTVPKLLPSTNQNHSQGPNACAREGIA